MPTGKIVREALRLPGIGCESKYEMHGSRHIMSNGAGLPEHLLFSG